MKIELFLPKIRNFNFLGILTFYRRCSKVRSVIWHLCSISTHVPTKRNFQSERRGRSVKPVDITILYLLIKSIEFYDILKYTIGFKPLI